MSTTPPIPPPPPMSPPPPPMPSSFGPGGIAGRTFAGFWRRFGAVLIDGLLLAVLDRLIAGPLTDTPDTGPMALSAVVSLGLTWWFYAEGWSPGRAVTGIRIVAADGGKPGAVRGLKRVLMSFVSAIALFLGYLAMLWHPERRTWHDRVADTWVVRSS
jgi:uncharacterized RDD family membrane protein YckC